MKKTYIYLSLILFVLLISPLVALAIEYPFGGMNGDNVTPAQYIHTLLIWGLGLIGAMAVIGVAVGGIMYMLGKPEQGKDIIYSSLEGLLLLFGAWLLIYTIDPNLAVLKNPSLETLAPISTPGAAVGGGGTESEQSARDILSQSGIETKAVCPAGQSTNCVNLDGIRENTLNEVTSLAGQVGASNVFVTAGTEGCGTVHNTGPTSHCNGYKVDLRPNDALDQYITNNFTPSGIRSDGAALYKAPDNSVYARESDHWDVLAS